MDTRNPPDIEVVRDAERILDREKWRVYEERAAQRLAETSSLAWTRLFPDSPVIHVVAVNGVVVGRVRRQGSRWIATEIGQRAPTADCGALRAAVGTMTSKTHRC
jgi:hypothetical protein